MFTADKRFSNIYLFVCFYYQSDAIIINVVAICSQSKFVAYNFLQQIDVKN